MGPIKREKPGTSSSDGRKTKNLGKRKTNFTDAQLLAASNENALQGGTDNQTVSKVFETFKRLKIYNDQKLRHRLFEYLGRHIMDICKKFKLEILNNLEKRMRDFCKILTIEINHLERCKNNFQGADITTLLNLLLALFFIDNINDKRECILTAYSLNPTENNFDLIVKYSKINHTTTNNDENLSPPTHLPEWLMSDIKCLLTWPRIKTLSWSNSWCELEKKCRLYLQPNNKIKKIRMQTAAANNDLKYLNDKLNYELYENWEPYNYPGIEKGYCVKNNENPDIDKINTTTTKTYLPPEYTAENQNQNETTPNKSRQITIIQQKSGETFVQDESCSKFGSTILKCRDCRNSNDTENVVCRFYNFRKLRYSEKHQHFVVDGFLHPTDDPTAEDIKLWDFVECSNNTTPSKDLNWVEAEYIISEVADFFCKLYKDEMTFAEMNNGKTLGWKRVIKHVRKNCDVCETSIFNYHCTCEHCGFVVCTDCYIARTKNEKNKNVLADEETEERDEFYCLHCTDKKNLEHSLKNLMQVQVIPGDLFSKLRDLLHNRHLCHCPLSMIIPDISAATSNNTICSDEKMTESNVRKLDFYDLLSRTENTLYHRQIFFAIIETLEPPEIRIDDEVEHDKTRYRFPMRIMTLSLSRELYPKVIVEHEWYCNGRLLCLLNPKNPDNLKIFQQQWKRGQPVLISNAHEQLNKNLWCPESFSTEFGEQRNDLVNCLTGATVPNQLIKMFWDGFDYENKRMKNDSGEPMLLKLKDWPASEDFATQFPTRFQDLMNALPLGEYTKRNGKFNLARYLPDYIRKPDLGPKMYIAYGSATHAATKGTTILHLDMSDAVNVMVYVGIPNDEYSHLEVAYRAIEESDSCDELQLQRIKEK